MADVWIANASPVIVLAKVGHLDFLQGLPSTLILPEAVVAEVLAGPESDPAHQALQGGWGLRQRTLGVVLRAKKAGLIPRAGEVLKAIRAAGLHLDDRTVRLALARIGEPWEPQS